MALRRSATLLLVNVGAIAALLLLVSVLYAANAEATRRASTENTFRDRARRRGGEAEEEREQRAPVSPAIEPLQAERVGMLNE